MTTDDNNNTVKTHYPHTNFKQICGADIPANARLRCNVNTHADAAGSTKSANIYQAKSYRGPNIQGGADK